MRAKLAEYLAVQSPKKGGSAGKEFEIALSFPIVLPEAAR